MQCYDSRGVQHSAYLNPSPPKSSPHQNWPSPQLLFELLGGPRYPPMRHGLSGPPAAEFLAPRPHFNQVARPEGLLNCARIADLVLRVLLWPQRSKQLPSPLSTGQDVEKVGIFYVPCHTESPDRRLHGDLQRARASPVLNASSSSSQLLALYHK